MSLLSKIAKGLKKVVKKALPFVPGPVGTIARIATGAAAVGGIASAARALPGGAQAPPVFPALQMAAVAPAATGAASLPAIGRAAQTIAGVIRSQTGRITAVVVEGGRRLSRAQVRTVIRKMGPAAATTALGLTAMEVAEIIATTPRRRGRGISPTDVRRTKATIRKVCQITKGIDDVKKARKSCR